MTPLPSLVQRFFTDRLCAKLAASPNTIAAYRDTFRLLLQFASEQAGKPPTKLTLEQLDVTLVADFLTHMEDQRGNSAPQPERTIGFDTLVLQVRLHDGTSPLAALPEDTGDARQALRAASDRVSQSRRDECALGRSGSKHLDRQTGPRDP